MALNCCCQATGCNVNTSTGIVRVNAWKLDHTANPVATRPHCRYFRTLTATVTNGLSVIVAIVTMRFTIQQGGIDSLLTLDTSLVPATTMSGADPCGGVGILTAGTITNRTDTGHTAVLSGTGGCAFAGSVRYEFSDEVFITDVEAAAQLLASMVNWNTFPTDQQQVVTYQNGAITFQSSANMASNGDPLPNLCGGGSGYVGVAGSSAWMYYRNHPRAPGFAWLPLPSFANTGSWPGIVFIGRAWTSRIVIPGQWCEVHGPMVRDSGGFPTVCGISSSAATCGPLSSSAIRQQGGTIIFPPPASMEYIRVGCTGLAANCD